MGKTAMQKHLEWLKGRMVVSPQMESQLLEEEKQQILKSFIEGRDKRVDYFNPNGYTLEEENYYNRTFKQD
jgi:hypothetical protein